MEQTEEDARSLSEVIVRTGMLALETLLALAGKLARLCRHLPKQEITDVDQFLCAVSGSG